jgi:hypothetical protein
VTAVPATVKMPVREAVDVFAATVYPTLAAPLPLALLVTVIQEAPPVAVQLQPLCVVTTIVPVAPPEATERLAGETVNVQMPACVTVTAVPATVKMPVREAVDVFAATVYPTLAAPLPLALLVTVIQEAPLVAVQLQPLAAVTPIVPFAPATGGDSAVGETPKVHGSAPWTTVAYALPAVRVAVRAGPVFSATTKLTLPLPLAGGVVTVSHPAELLAAQPHPGPASTLTAPVPPDAVNDIKVDIITSPHAPENENELDGALSPIPFGPTASTRAS